MRSKPHTRVLIAVGALSVSAVVPLALPSGAQTITNCSVSSTDLAIDAEEQKLLDLVNQYRAANGRNRLAFQTDVTRAAAWMSRDMATKNRFSHTDSLGRSMSTRLTQCGVSYTNAAENIAAGQTTAQAVFDAWKRSTGHNSNMLRTGVSAAGIGRAYNANSTYKWYWTLNVTNTSVSSTTSSSVTTSSSTTTSSTTTTTSSTTRTTRCYTYSGGMYCF